MKLPSSQNRAGLAKTAGITACGLGALLLAGCVVTSVYPWYADKDVVFEPALIGSWVEAAATNTPNDSVRFERAAGDAYTMTILTDGKSAVHEAHLFKLKDGFYLDYVPREGHEDFIPPHYLLKVDRLPPSLQLRGMNYRWLAELTRTNARAIRHVVVNRKPDDPQSGRVVLTANTAELQSFLRNHAADANCFDEPGMLKRQ